ncbi:MAG: aminotransferase class V-fold PLP-dependent enzyme [Pseudomonadota bacterium]
MTYRDAFPYPDHAYFLSHSVGIPPHATAQAFNASYFEPWSSGGGDAWDYWLRALDEHRNRLAAIIGAQADDLCQQVNVSSALTKILFSLPERPERRKIVLCEDDFPTIGHVLAQARRLGYDLEFIKGGPALADPEIWARALSDDVHLVHITHVFSNACVRTPIADIVKSARKAGIWSIVDIAQSAGAVPVLLDEWRPDFATGTSVKYLCGGPGAAFLWANPDTTGACEPIDVGWFSHEAPFEFDIRDFRYASTAAKYWGGTPSVAPFALAAEALTVLSEIGVDAVFAHNQALLDILVDALPPSAFLSHTDRRARGSACVIRPTQFDAARAALENNGVRHDMRGGGLRFSFHLYNAADEVAQLAETLADYC